MSDARREKAKPTSQARSHSPVSTQSTQRRIGNLPSSSRESLQAERRLSGFRSTPIPGAALKGVPGHDVLISTYGDSTERIQIRPHVPSSKALVPAHSGQFPHKALAHGEFADYASPPSDPSGRIVDVSDRPLVCSAFNGTGEIVIGGSDHALYSLDVNAPRKAPTKLYNKRWGHNDWVTGCTFLASGRVLSCGMDSKLCLWSLDKRRCQELQHHNRSISAVASGELDMAYSAAYDCTVAAWALRGSERETEGVAPISVLRGHKSPVLELVTQGSLVASGGKDGAIVCWDAPTGDCLMRMRAHDASVTKLLLRPNDGLLISGSADGFIKTWDPRTKDLLASSCSHKDKASGSGAPVAGLATVGEHLIVSGGADNSVQVMDRRRDGSPVFSFSSCRTGVYSLVAAPDDRCVFVGDGSGILSCFDVVAGRLCYGIGASSTGAVRCIIPISNNSQIVTAGEDGKLLFFTY
jgi:WD40 repeat protein